jgi:nitroreductase
MNPKEKTMNESEQVMSLADAVATRQSIRSYASGRLDRRVINTLLAAAVRAPNAIQEERWGFAVAQGKPILRHLSDLAKKALSELESNAHLPYTPSLHKFDGPDVNLFYNAETLIVICATSMAPFAPADCWLAAENLMLSARAMGLGTCVIGSAVLGLNTAQGKSLLGVPKGTLVVAPIIVGVSNDSDVPLTKRSDPLILSWLQDQ